MAKLISEATSQAFKIIENMDKKKLTRKRDSLRESKQESKKQKNKNKNNKPPSVSSECTIYDAINGSSSPSISSKDSTSK